MTRLIDADALIDYFNFDGLVAGDTIAITDVQAIIDAALTVSCEECEQESTSSQRCEECLCGSDFKRRQKDDTPRPRGIAGCEHDFF